MAAHDDLDDLDALLSMLAPHRRELVEQFDQPYEQRAAALALLELQRSLGDAPGLRT